MGRSELIASGQVAIKATPVEVFELVSDPLAMVAFVEETTGVRWLGRARRSSTGTSLGAKFRGSNRNGWRRWFTTCRVTELEPGRRFAFTVRTPFMVPISRWAYELEPTPEGCVVTESAWLRVPKWFVPFAIAITGEPDRPGVNQRNIDTTLSRLKAHFEPSLTGSAAPARG